MDVHEGEILTPGRRERERKNDAPEASGGFYPPPRGKIKVFGKSPKAHGNAYYKEIIAYLPPESPGPLLEETVGKEVDGETLRNLPWKNFGERHPMI